METLNITEMLEIVATSIDADIKKQFQQFLFSLYQQEFCKLSCNV
jgi:hypothetical protein